MGSFQAALSIEHVVSRLNERLKPPLFARVEDDTETIRIGDICRLYDIDPETLAVEEDHTTSIAEPGQQPALKDIIRQLQQTDEQRVGVPEAAVIELLTYAGCSREDVTDELQRLRDQGEIYSPKQGYVRLV